MSLYFPLSISVKEKNDLTHSHPHDDDDPDSDPKLGGNHPGDNRRPVFDVCVVQYSYFQIN